MSENKVRWPLWHLKEHG